MGRAVVVLLSLTALVASGGCSRPSRWTNLCPPTFPFSPAAPPAWSRTAKAAFELREYEVCTASAATATAAVEKELLVYTARQDHGAGYAGVDYQLLTKQEGRWRRDLLSRSECPTPDEYRNCKLDELMKTSQFDLTIDGDRIAITTKSPSDFSWIAEVRAKGPPMIRSVPSAPTPRELLERDRSAPQAP